MATEVREDELARRVLETFPLLMRSFAKELRDTDQRVEANQFQILGMLAHCPSSVSALAAR